jgi:pilus assembly protein CpaE
MPLVDARYYKALLISPNKTVASEVAPLLAYGLPLAPIHDINAYPNGRQLAELLQSVEPKLCFLDFSTEAQAFELLGELRSTAATLPIIALLNANKPDLVLQCMRQGATDFLIRPFTTDQIDACVEKITRMIPAPSRAPVGGKVIVVMPAKGSSGATTLACNLAYQCKRLGASKVLLGDLDPLSGTISFVLKLKSTYSFVDVVHREDSLDGDLWKQMMTSAHGVDVLLGPESFVDPHSELSSAAPIVEFAQSIYDAIVLDCGGVYGTWTLSLARLADSVLLTTSSELSSLHATQRALAYFDNQRLEMDKVKLVVNRYQKDAGLHTDSLGEALRSEIFQVVPSDTDAVQKSLMDGKPIQPNSPIGKSLAAMAHRLVEFRNKDVSKATKGRLLSSLFR